MPIIVENLSHSYGLGLPGEHRALCGVSFQADPGCVTAVLGHTGSGKSTLAQHLNALITPQSGTVSVDGLTTESADKRRSVRKKVGLVFQYPEEQIFAENIREEIAFAPRNWGLSEDEIEAVIPEAMAAVGLDLSMLDLSPFNISGGQRRRVAIASVIAARPDYLVLDEPTAGLDASSARELSRMLASFAEGGMGIIHITHDIELALTEASKILVLEEGRVVSFQPPAQTAETLCCSHIKGLVLPEVLRISAALKERGKTERLAWTPEQLIEEIRSAGHVI
ncbi:MAG: ATP-binding cassette domain-containing protein [Cloacibacillus sp.]